jgi:hypothetical protein
MVHLYRPFLARRKSPQKKFNIMGEEAIPQAVVAIEREACQKTNEPFVE